MSARSASWQSRSGRSPATARPRCSRAWRSSRCTSSWLGWLFTSSRAKRFHLFLRQLTPLAGPEALDAEPRIAAAVQVDDRVADRFAHALHLVLASLVDRELDSRGAEEARAGGRRPAVLQLEALSQAAQRLRPRLPLHVGDVDLLDLVARMREPVRERAVVGEQERAGRVGVEAADRDDARGVTDEADDGRASVRIACRRHDAGRLVQQHVGELLRTDALTVHLDDVT